MRSKLLIMVFGILISCGTRKVEKNTHKQEQKIETNTTKETETTTESKVVATTKATENHEKSEQKSSVNQSVKIVKTTEYYPSGVVKKVLEKSENTTQLENDLAYYKGNYENAIEILTVQTERVKEQEETIAKKDEYIKTKLSEIESKKPSFWLHIVFLIVGLGLGFLAKNKML